MKPESKRALRAVLLAGSTIFLILFFAAEPALPVSGAAEPAAPALAAGPSCTDSDGGIAYGIAGMVEGIGPQGYAYQKADECLTGEWEGYLKEMFCKGTTPWPQRFECPNGCADGACIDYGDEVLPAPAGAGTQGASAPLPTPTPEPCPGDHEVCDNGVDDDCNGLADGQDPACGLCADTDGGANYFSAGETTGVSGETFADACAATPGELTEYACAIDGSAEALPYTCPGACVDGACEAPNLVLIGWDGVQWDHLQECYAGQAPGCPNGLPNLKALSDGVLYPNVTSSGGTATKPGWAQILSGYDAEVTGITSNSEYQPIPEGYTVLEKLENRFGPGNLVTMFISGKGEHTSGACIGEVTYHRGELSPEEIGQPWCLTKEHLDYYENDLRQNEVVGARAIELLDKHQDDLFIGLFLFREPDVIGHAAGEDSVRYSQSLVELDGWLGQIVDKLDTLGIAGRTLVYVVTDHGFDEGASRHSNAPYGFFASNDPLIVRPGDRTDVAATILDRYGIGPGAVDGAPPIDGYSLYSIPPLSCIPAGESFLAYDGAPVCCDGLDLLPREVKLGAECIPSTGGTGIVAGYCADCGNGTCDAGENRCTCPDDCGAVITRENAPSGSQPGGQQGSGREQQPAPAPTPSPPRRLRPPR